MDVAECQNRALGAIGNAPQQPMQAYNPQNPYAGLMAAQGNVNAAANVAIQRQYFVDSCLYSKGYYKSSN